MATTAEMASACDPLQLISFLWCWAELRRRPEATAEVSADGVMRQLHDLCKRGPAVPDMSFMTSWHQGTADFVRSLRTDSRSTRPASPARWYTGPPRVVGGHTVALLLLPGESYERRALASVVCAFRRLRGAGVLQRTSLVRRPTGVCFVGLADDVHELQVGVGAQAMVRRPDTLTEQQTTALHSLSDTVESWPRTRARCAAAARELSPASRRRARETAAGAREEAAEALLLQLQSAAWLPCAPPGPHAGGDAGSRVDAAECDALLAALRAPLQLDELEEWYARVRRDRDIQSVADKLRRLSPRDRPSMSTDAGDGGTWPTLCPTKRPRKRTRGVPRVQGEAAGGRWLEALCGGVDRLTKFCT